MRVLSVLNPTLNDYNISGAALLGINLGNKLNKRGDAIVDFISSNTIRELVNKNTGIYVPEVRSSRAVKDTIEYAVRIFNTGNYDVMHIHLHQMSVLANIVECIPEYIPVVYTQHSSTILGRFSLGYRPSAYALTNIRKNCRIVCPSCSMVDIWKEYIESDKIENVRMIRNGVQDVTDIDYFDPYIIPADINERYISVGRIDPNKGMLEVAETCVKSNKKLVVVGTLGMGSLKISDNAQEYYNKFVEICANNPDLIIWYKYMNNSNIRRLMKRSKGYISMSNKESFGLTVAESISVGTPVMYLEENAIMELTDSKSSVMISKEDIYRKSHSKKIDIFSRYLDMFDMYIDNGEFNRSYIVNRSHDLGITMDDCANNYLKTYLDVIG